MVGPCSSCCRAIERGRWTLLDEDAALDEGEFFAVATEYFFGRPVELAEQHPQLYDLLRVYYRQDPARRPSVAARLTRRTRAGHDLDRTPVPLPMLHRVRLIRYNHNRSGVGGERNLEDRYMATVSEIVAAAAQLDPEQFLELRRELDRLEQELWEAELDQTTAELEQAHVTDEDIDQMVMKRRRESRR
jgi:hypothetical protein